MILDREKCVGCGACAEVCSFNAIEMKDGYPSVNDRCVDCGMCAQACSAEAIAADAMKKEFSLADYSGYWVIGLEAPEQASLSKVTLELLSTAHELKEQKAAPVSLAVFAETVPQAWIADAASVGCDQIIALQSDGCGYNFNERTELAVSAANALKPEVILLPAVADGRDLAPKISCRLNTGLTADCTGLRIGEDGNLLQIRPTYGGNIIATICTPENRPQMASVRPNVMQIKKTAASKPVVRSYRRSVKLCKGVELLKVEDKNASFQSFDEARVILAGGYGLGCKENFDLLFRLGAKLNAAVAASRKAVDAEWVSSEIQIGQTGKTVAPDIYIGFGISGALQHTLGMNRAKRIIAVNNDPAAPIMKMCDVPILADAPQLIRKMIDLLDGGYSPNEMLDKVSG